MYMFASTKEEMTEDSERMLDVTRRINRSKTMDNVGYVEIIEVHPEQGRQNVSMLYTLRSIRKTPSNKIKHYKQKHCGTLTH